MRMAVGAAVTPAPPRRRPFLRDADHDHPEASLALGGLQMRTRELLLGLALREPHDRHLVRTRELLDRGDVRAALPGEQRRRGDRKPAIEQEPDGPSSASARTPARTGGRPSARAASPGLGVGW